MRVSDFLRLMLCCLCWAGNLAVSAWALGSSPVPPFMLACIRSIIVLVCMSPFLLIKPPKHWIRLAVVCACVGPLHLGFLYTGLQTASASGSSIVAQMLIPFATILSVLFLKEKIGGIRGLGIIGAFIGTIVMVYEPGALSFDMGLISIVIAYFSLAVGSVLMKKVGDVDWRQYVVWVALMVFVSMGLATALFETNQAQVWASSKWPLLITAVYAALAVSIIAHGQYFELIKKYEVSLIVPLTLIMPVFACILGVVFLKETIFLRYYLGAALILPCVYIIAKRGKTPAQGGLNVQNK